MIIVGNSGSPPYGYAGGFEAAARASSILGAMPAGKLVKQASSGSDAVKAVAEALAGMGVKANIDIGELLKRLADAGLNKEAAEKNGEDAEETVKIASKKIKDSHYFFDVAKTAVSRDGKSLIMVSAYMREGYLGRYLIKRNFYFLPDNGEEAADVYESLIKNCRRTKQRYYDDKISINDIFPEVKSFLDGTRGDLEDEEEDRAGTAYYRNKETGHHALEGTPYGGSA